MLRSWLGLTPREYSSGERRRLGGIPKTVTGPAPHTDRSSPSAKLLQIAFMNSGSVRGVAKPITIVPHEAHATVGSTPADLMMSRAAQHTPLTYRTNTRLQPFPLLIDPGLTEESIPDC